MLKLEQLNEMQRRAVEDSEEGPVLVLAGPGSGKTFTITQRILYLIQVLHIPSHKILVLTFTKDAAVSMEQRFRDSLSTQFSDSNVYFSTFHSLFYQILRESLHLPKNHMLSNTEKKQLLKKAAYDTFCHKSPGAAVSAGTLLEFAEAISLYKNTCNKEKAAQKLSQEYREHFDALSDCYEILRRQSGKMDFDDVLWDCRELLSKNKTVREHWQNKFEYLLIDEFQDINPIQYQVIGLLSKPPYRILAVGDDDQAIYGFRGSEPACLRRFQEEYHARQIVLGINYRSTREIVSCAEKVIRENTKRFEKHMSSGVPDSEQGSMVKISHFVTREEEYTYLVKQITDGVQDGISAVLFRTNSQMQKFAAFLRMHHVDFQVKEKIRGLYEHKVIQDVMMFLKMVEGLENREERIAVMHFLEPDAPGEALAEIQKRAEDILVYYQRELLWEEAEDGKRRERLITERNRIQEKLIRLRKLKGKPFFLNIACLRKVLGYEVYLKELYKEQPDDYLEACQVLEWIQTQSGKFRTLEEWMQYQKEIEFEQKNKTADKNIVLMTMHGAKGLEFDRVWIPDCNERTIPYGVLPDDDSLEEERRIFYVGITRAKKYLELTYLTGTKDNPRYPSRFLNPIR